VSAKQEKTTIKGTVATIRFRNSDGWAVFTVKNSETASNMPCTGLLAQMIDIGSEVTCTGKLEINQYGRQLKCESIVPEAPDVSSSKGVIKLLQRLPGIGPKKAEIAVNQFGHEAAWKYACEDPCKIGVLESRKEAAIAVATSLIDSYDTTVYLLSIGLTDNQAATIYSVFGKDTKKIVSEDPYQLIKIDGFGFLTVDKIALKAGVSIGSPSRIAACIMYVVADSSLNGGHIWHAGWELADIVLDTLSNSALKAEVPMIGFPVIEDVRKQVHFLKAEGKLEVEKGKVYPKGLLTAEQSILSFVGV
jgi:exodeoxyribonuclease V alpha subunit